MKILFLSHYYLPEGNAPATRVSALSTRWAEQGHDVTILTCEPNVPNGILHEGYRNTWTMKEDINGVHVIRVWSWIVPNKGTFLRIVNYISFMISAFLHGLSLQKPDIMIATSPQFFCAWAGLLLHWTRRFPFVLEIRDMWPDSMPAVGVELPRCAISICAALESALYRFSGHIVTLGEGYRKKLIEKGTPAEKIDIVMNGVDQRVFYPHSTNRELLAKYNIEGKFICSYIGTIGLACGLATALDAAELLQNEGNSRIHFLFVGDGAMRAELEKDAKERNLSNVTFTGLRPKDEIPDWVASSDVSLVHLKRAELFTTVIPSKIFESAGCAKPMILGVSGHVKNLIIDAEAGIPIEPENPVQMFSALKLLASNPELCKKYGDNAYNNICKKYNRDIQAVEYIQILENFLTHSR